MYPKITAKHAAVLLVILGLSFFTLIPIISLFYSTLFTDTGEFTLDVYLKKYSQPDFQTLLANTTFLALGKTIVALTLGIPLAFLISRTDIPRPSLFGAIATVYLFVPDFLHAVGWTRLASVGSGLFNVIIRTLTGSDPGFSIYTPLGLALVSGLQSVPIVFLIVSTALESVNTELEECARVTGSNVLSAIRHVTLPMIKPSIFSAGLLILIFGYADFGVPWMIGIRQRFYVLSTDIFRVISISNDFKAATAVGTVMWIVTVMGSIIYIRMLSKSFKFVTITGRGYRPTILKLKKARPFFTILLLAYTIVNLSPIGVLVLDSLSSWKGAYSMQTLLSLGLDNYIMAYQTDIFQRALLNTFVLALIGPIVATAIAIVVSYISMRKGTPLKGVVNFMSMLPISFPEMLLGLAVLWTFVATPLYQTVWIIVIAISIKFLPLLTRALSSVMVQVGEELEESSRVTGASWLTTMRRIVIPLVGGGVLAAWFLGFASFMKELATVTLLGGPGNEVLATAVFLAYNDGEYEQVSVFSVTLVLFSAIVYVLFRKLVKRYGVSAGLA